MSLIVYTTEQAEEWDRIVCSFEDYDVYFMCGYVKAFKQHGDGEPMLFYYESKNSSLRGINVVMKRDIANDERFRGKFAADKWFDFVTPYGYGGWLLEGEGDRLELFRAYDAWCRQHNIVSEFVRYHPVLENCSCSEGPYEVISLGNTISMDISSPGIIWKNLTSKNRNMIRKAIKSGIAIYNGRYPEIYEHFREIYNKTMDKDHAESYYYFAQGFYKSILMDLPQNAQVFYSELKGKIVAASIILAANGRLSYHLSGSLREYQNLAPTNLLLYEAALWGSANGCRTFHLGGGVGSSEDSLYNFKKAFYRGTPCRFCIGKKIFMDDEYGILSEIREEPVKNSAFFPEYRA